MFSLNHFCTAFAPFVHVAFIYNHINGWSNSCQRILWAFGSRLLCKNGWRYIEYKSMFLYNFLCPKKKEKTDFFLTPAVWPQIAAQSVSLLIDTLYISSLSLRHITLKIPMHWGWSKTGSVSRMGGLTVCFLNVSSSSPRFSNKPLQLKTRLRYNWVKYPGRR